jgi:hypothetical protein
MYSSAATLLSMTLAATPLVLRHPNELFVEALISWLHNVPLALLS